LRLELHYRAGEDSPWVAKWSHPNASAGEAVAAEAGEALERAGREIERTFEEKSGEDIAIEKAIKE
jgi:hypothetical protein